VNGMVKAVFLVGLVVTVMTACSAKRWEHWFINPSIPAYKICP